MKHPVFQAAPPHCTSRHLAHHLPAHGPQAYSKGLLSAILDLSSHLQHSSRMQNRTAISVISACHEYHTALHSGENVQEHLLCGRKREEFQSHRDDRHRPIQSPAPQSTSGKIVNNYV